MKKTFFCFGLTGILLALLGCGKNITTSDVLSNLIISNKNINADGSTTVTLSVVVNSSAGPNKRNVVFTASGGTLVNGANGKVTATADFQNTQLIATATLKAPMTPGEIIITAAPESMSPNGDYILKDSITVNNVLPATIKLETSSYGIGSNFTTTDSLVGTLKSASNKKVSLGAKVTFEDYFPNGLPAGGRFRSVSSTSDINSQVMALYSSLALPIGTNIFVKATVLDNAGIKTNIRDSVLLTVNQ